MDDRKHDEPEAAPPQPDTEATAVEDLPLTSTDAAAVRGGPLGNTGDVAALKGAVIQGDHQSAVA